MVLRAVFSTSVASPDQVRPRSAETRAATREGLSSAAPP